MDVYMFQAALWCEDCGEALREQMIQDGEAPEDPDDEESYDSDEFPKGPYGDGGGEADSPQHCDAGEHCINAVELSSGSKVGAFLENPLTDDGNEYVREAVLEAKAKKKKGSVALEIWKPYYDYIDYRRPRRR